MSTSTGLRIAIVGAGAAGYFAAINAARTFPNARIELLEATRQPLYKVGISGGGRCNVTHHCFDIDRLLQGYPRGFKELIGPFQRFQPRDTVQWFESRGVRLKAEDDGRMFPVTDDSATIIACLQHSADTAGVTLRLHARVTGISRDNDESPTFRINFKGGTSTEFDRVLLATGSSPIGYEIASSLGHKIIPPVPSLFTFKIKDERLHGLSGISFPDVALTLEVGDNTLEQRGPLLITHWGLSGPAVLKLSAWGARLLFTTRYQAILRVNLLPEQSLATIEENLQRYRAAHPRRAITAHPLYDLPRRYWERIVADSAIAPELTWSHITRQQQSALVEQLANARFAITGKGEFKDEFVTAGGVRLKEVDFRTMASRLCPGLYFAGEILDIDGITGGYNFQAAWSTGWVAGESIGR